ncbi:hypothetical protein WR25_02448 [Diploscapter pachys]|uniref:MARVEL domain-containing protein n=1 Tax=Diploscapter pachys TaxID=2018661 RepID=A0A2A2KKA4_9BILA|nr:hypothetical protein WR25_02448 [Diploscapter pachys]
MAAAVVFKFVYGFLIFLAFIITGVALFTPGWRSYDGDDAPMMGLVTRDCGSNNRAVESFDCARWHEMQFTFEQVTLALMIVAWILQFIALAFFCGLFTRARLALPATTLCFLAFIAILIALIVYGVRYQRKIAYMMSVTYELLADVHLGYSYWLASVGCIFTLLATLAAG